MKKAIVIGCPGSGKSTFSRALHNALGLPLIHLDLLYWNADRTTVPKPVFLERLQAAMAEERWIIDGNFSSTMELRMQACDTVFFLDYPVEVCLAGIAARKGTLRPDLPWREPEEDDEEFLTFVRGFHSGERPAILDLLSKYTEKQIFTFRSRGEADEFLRSLNQK